MSSRSIFSFLLIGFLFSLSGLRASTQEIYKELYPYFAMPCAVSQYTPIDDEQPGGRYGHAVLFLQGACLEKNKDFPSITTECSPQDRELGLSADMSYGNLNATGVPGYELFFNGNWDESSTLDRSYSDRIVAEAMATGAFRGVRPPAQNSTEPDFRSAEEIELRVAQGAVGTDYALRFARNVYCERIPVTPRMMQRMVSFVNQMNARYRYSEEGFRLQFSNNNCTHFVHNTLAAAGLWRPKAINSIDPVGTLSNLAVPGNEIADIIRAAHEKELPTLDDFYSDDQLADLLVKENYVFVQAGNLFEFMPIHGESNTLNRLFKTDSVLKVIDLIPFNSVTRTYRKALDTPRYHRLYDQLLRSQELYRKAWKNLPDERWLRIMDRPLPFRSHKYSYRKLYQLYKAHLEAKLIEVQKHLSFLEHRGLGAPLGRP